MSGISASLVKTLRDRSAAGMMDCKCALTETGGDIEAAIDWLRTKGLSKAATRAGRSTVDGVIAARVLDGTGVLVEVNTETDFVARNERFQTFVSGVLDAALVLAQSGEAIWSEEGRLVEAILNSKGAENVSIRDALFQLIATLGEQMVISRACVLSTSTGVIGNYVHSRIGEGMGRIGVLVALDTDVPGEDVLAEARKYGMHIAASQPFALSADDLDPVLLEREKHVLAEKAKQAGKPPRAVEMIISSGLKSFQKSSCLLDQPYVHDPSVSVRDSVLSIGKRLNSKVELSGFRRFSIGETVQDAPVS